MRKAAVIAVLLLAGFVVRRADASPWLERAFLCIHSHEGAWNANTGNGYYGGLQMDSTFELTYGYEFVRRWGHAHNWPVRVQLLVAERAYRTRGFWPWKTTARMCGLL